MSYEKVAQAKQIVVGTKQTLKAIEQGKKIEVILANDADTRITNKVVHLCHKRNVPVMWVDAMKKLGKACGIEVGTAAVAIILDDED